MTDNAGAPFLGSKISITSKSEIRYEGILYTVDTKQATVALAKVKSFGTEDRPTSHPIPAQDDVIYEYIIFRAADIKDLKVCESPQPIALKGGLPYDPAIIQVSSQIGENQAGGRGSAPTSRSTTPSAPFRSTTPTGEMGGHNAPHDYASALGSGLDSNRAPFYTSRAPGAGRFQQQGGLQQQQHYHRGAPGVGRGMQRGDEHSGGHGGFSRPGTNAQGQQHSRAGFGSSQAGLGGGQRYSQHPGSQRGRGMISGPPGGGAFGGSSRGAFGRDNTGGGAQSRGAFGGGGGFRRSSPVLGHQQQYGGGGYHIRNAGPLFGQGGPPRGAFGGGGRGAFGGGMNRQGPRDGGYGRGGGGFQRGGFRGGFGRGGGSGRPRNAGEGGTDQKFDKDYDFEEANAKFAETLKEVEEAIMKTHLGAAAAKKPEDKEDGEVEDEEKEEGDEEETKEAEEAEKESEAVFYDKAKSFFDTISCEALEKSEGRNNSDNRRNERRINEETFGQASLRRFGGYRGRGGFRGYYRNRYREA